MALSLSRALGLAVVALLFGVRAASSIGASAAIPSSICPSAATARPPHSLHKLGRYCVILFALHAPYIIAGQPPPTPVRTFSSLDANADGKVTYEEFISWHQELLRRRFRLFDLDGDGVITQAEFEAAHQPHSQGPQSTGPLGSSVRKP